jgi:hypothetical protein
MREGRTLVLSNLRLNVRRKETIVDHISRTNTNPRIVYLYSNDDIWGLFRPGLTIQVVVRQ